MGSLLLLVFFRSLKMQCLCIEIFIRKHMSNFTISLFRLVLKLTQKLLSFQRVTEGGKHCVQIKQQTITQAKFSECVDSIV